MPDKNVRVRMSVTGSADSKRQIQDVSNEADKFGKKDVNAKIGVFSKVTEAIKKATGQLDDFSKKRADATIGIKQDVKSHEVLIEFSKQLHDITDKVHNARIGADDNEGKAKLIDFDLKLKKLAETVANPKVGLDGEKKALADLYRLQTAVDKFGREHVTAHVDLKVKEDTKKHGVRGVFSDVFSGLFGKTAEKASEDAVSAGQSIGDSAVKGIGSAFQAAPPQLIPILITAMSAILLTTAPAILPVAFGLGIGIAGVIFGAMAKSKAGKEFKKDLTGTFNDIKNIVAKAATPLLRALEPVFRQIEVFTKQISPLLRDMFKNSVPFLKLFVTFLERTARVLFPILNNMLKEARPYLGEFLKGLMAIVRGFGIFLKILGPVIGPAMRIFVGLMRITEGIMVATGAVIFVLVKAMDLFVKAGIQGWHYIYNAAKPVIEYIGSHWHQWVEDAKKFFMQFWLSLKAVWNDMKVAWHALTGFLVSAWHDTVNTAKSLWNSFWGWLKGVWNTLKNAWHTLTAFVVSAWHDTVNTAKSLWNDFWNWLKGVWQDLRNAWRILTGFVVAAWHDVTNFIKTLWNDFWNWLKGIWNTLINFWHTLTEDVKHAWSDVENFLKASWNRIRSFAGTIWNDIKNAAAKPVAFIVNDVWDPFARAINAALSFLHLGGKNTLPTPNIKGFAEGGVVPGPPVKADIIPAMLTPGERVLSLSQVSAMGGHSAIDRMVGPGTGGPHFFAGGGTAGQPGPLSGRLGGQQEAGVGGVIAGLGNLGSDLVNFGKDLVKGGLDFIISKLGPIATHLVGTMLNNVPGGRNTMMNQMATGVVRKVILDLQQLVTSTAKAENSAGGVQGMRNPLRKIKGLTPERIDMGVDYAGSGPIFAITKGVITETLNSGWPGGAFIGERLTASPYAGRYVYFAENITPRVHTGQKVDTNTVIGILHDASPNMEAGWAAPPGTGNTMAQVLHQAAQGDPGGHTSAMGLNFAQLLHALGAPMGHRQGGGVFGKVPKGFYSKQTAGVHGTGGAAIYNYLLSNLFGGHKRAAAGAIASIWGESGWNPEAQGTGGRGLIGWTPARDLPNYAFTGNAQKDMASQLPLIIKFVRENGDMGVIREMMRAKTVLEAANLWGRGVERFQINDVHPEGISLAKKIAGLKMGGIINEPIVGIGLKTQTQYNLGEGGISEAVIPLSGPGANAARTALAGGGDVYIFNVQGDTDPDAAAKRIHQNLRRLKKKRGGQRLGLD